MRCRECGSILVEGYCFGVYCNGDESIKKKNLYEIKGGKNGNKQEQIKGY